MSGLCDTTWARAGFGSAPTCLFLCWTMFGSGACATTTTTVVHDEAAPETSLTATERWLVMEGAADSPMRVVLNDNAAGEAFLRTPSLPAKAGDPELEHLVSRMLATVELEQGVGIAAPQVGISRRVMLVKRLDQEPEQPFVAYVNPELVQPSQESVIDWEGCLSIPAGFGQVRRPAAVEISYETAEGGRQRERIEGFTARIFLHELDHLDGVLFLDRKEPGELMPEEAYREMRAREREQASSAPAEPVSSFSVGLAGASLVSLADSVDGGMQR